MIKNKEMKNVKKIKIVLILISICGVICIALAFILNKYSIPTKEERLNNMITYQGKTQLDKNDVVNEINAIFKKHTNWDNLFISENFKNKYKNRKGLINEVDDFSSIWCASDDESNQENIVVVYCDKKGNNFNDDKSKEMTVEYYFQYVLNENNEIDDLVFIKKYNTYTINGERINE